MHYQIKEREQATQIARDRELFYWLSGFYITSLFGCVSFYQRTRRPVTLLPMVPLSFVMAYYADLAYGSKIHRIKGKSISTSFVCHRYCFNFLNLLYFLLSWRSLFCRNLYKYFKLYFVFALQNVTSNTCNFFNVITYTV